MSWLRDHFYNFVYPAVLVASGNNNPLADVVADASPYYPEIPPGHWLTSCTAPSEIRRLRWLCEFLHVPFNTSRRANGERGILHFDVLRRTLQSAEAARKAHGCSKLLLTGRDTWALEVLAKRKNIKTVFIPELSRLVCGGADEPLLDLLVDKYNLDGSELFVDTGFAGSIIIRVNTLLARLGMPGVKCALMSQDKWAGSDYGKHRPNLPPLNTYPYNSSYSGWRARLFDIERGNIKKPLVDNPNHRPNQLFPNRKQARQEALDTEYLPKYFKSGTVRDHRVVQYLASAQEIVQAAVLTSDIWRGIKKRPEALPVANQQIKQPDWMTTWSNKDKIEGIEVFASGTTATTTQTFTATSTASNISGGGLTLYSQAIPGVWTGNYNTKGTTMK